MQDNTQTVKRRRSNFDVTPEQLSVGTLQQQSSLSSVLLPNVSLIQHSNVLGSESLPYISVVDRSFTLKLEKAMLKNFDYIDRKDLLIAEALLRGEVYSEQSKAFKTVPSSSFGKYNFAPPTKPGIGSGTTTTTSNEPSKTVAPKVEPVSVYVSGLPKDITEEEIGKIKKIKLYTDEKGEKKGDALITYTTSDSAAMACYKLHKLNIGDGHILSVTKAEFNNNNNKTTTTTTGSSEEVITASAEIEAMNQLHDDDIRNHLPVECEAAQYAVLIFWQAFDPMSEDANEVETEYLLACCPFGNVRIIQLVPLLSALTASSTQSTIHSTSTLYSIIVTFEDPLAAKKCLDKIQGDVLMGKKVNGRLLLPTDIDITLLVDTTIIPSTTTTAVDAGETPMTIEAAITMEHIAGLPLHQEEEESVCKGNGNSNENENENGDYDTERIQQEVDSVEDFLNSLL